MSEVGAFEAKTNLPRLLKRVQAGERFVITRHNRPVAELIPFRERDVRAGLLGRRFVGACVISFSACRSWAAAHCLTHQHLRWLSARCCGCATPRRASRRWPPRLTSTPWQ